jgi:hypothetical protein
MAKTIATKTATPTIVPTMVAVGDVDDPDTVSKYNKCCYFSTVII